MTSPAGPEDDPFEDYPHGGRPDPDRAPVYRPRHGDTGEVDRIALLRMIAESEGAREPDFGDYDDDDDDDDHGAGGGRGTAMAAAAAAKAAAAGTAVAAGEPVAGPAGRGGTGTCPAFGTRSDPPSPRVRRC